MDWQVTTNDLRNPSIKNDNTNNTNDLQVGFVVFWIVDCAHNLMSAKDRAATATANATMETEDLAPPAGFAQVTPGLWSGHTTIAKAGTILNASPKLSMCNLRPHPSCALFVAWNGVITLVFSDSLVLAKKRFEVFLPGLAPEKFGSMWPKTTLGAVHDGCEDLSLSP